MELDTDFNHGFVLFAGQLKLAGFHWETPAGFVLVDKKKPLLSHLRIKKRLCMGEKYYFLSKSSSWVPGFSQVSISR
jgi:hypothetical protein